MKTTAGLYLHSPPEKIVGYPDLIIREILLKKDYLPAGQPVNHLRFRGLPIRQFLGEEITQIIFWLCSSFNILDETCADRTINLTPDQCQRDNLALLRGLGFNGVRLHIDASLASRKRSLDPVIKALRDLEDYKIKPLCGKIEFTGDTSINYLKALAEFLIARGIGELELDCHHGQLSLAGDRLGAERLYNRVVDLACGQGFQLLGDGCLKCPDHLDLMLRDQNRLRYGPWGFHDADTTEWLGVGVGATGISEDHIYHNTSDLQQYRQRIITGQSPVAGHSTHPVDEVPAFGFIQHLYCWHRVEQYFFRQLPDLLELFNTRQWVTQAGGMVSLTTLGALNIGTIGELYCREARRIESD